MQQRYTDPQLGVFLSVDPVAAYGQPVVQFNRYRYANGNPYKFTDPDGRNAAALAPLVIVPIVVATIYYSTSPEERADFGNKLEGAIKGAFHKSESGPREPALQGDGSIDSDRKPGSDGKTGSTGGPGAGKRFPKEPSDVRSSKGGVPCTYCGKPTTNAPGLPNSRERDHIDPKSRGGIIVQRTKEMLAERATARRAQKILRNGREVDDQ